MHLKKQNDFMTSIKCLSGDEDDDAGKASCCKKSSLWSDENPCKEKLDVLPSSMEDNARSQTSLCDLPYAVAFELMSSMDADEGWERLAAAAHYRFDDLLRLKRKLRAIDGSPTRCLLWELGCKSYTVKILYEKLKEKERYREMQILEKYVNGCSEKEEKSTEPAKKHHFVGKPLPKELDYRMLAGPESGFSSAGTEVNFNQPEMEDKSKVMVTSKKYGDKVIPGTHRQGELASLPSDFNTGISSEGNQRSLITRLSESLKISGNSLPDRLSPQRPQPIEMSETCIIPNPNGLQSMSSAYCSSASSTTSPTSGAENINKMLKDSFAGSTGSLAPYGSPGQRALGSSGSPTSSDLDRARMNEENMALTVKSTFSNEELFHATKGFSEQNVLGEGNFGKVYIGQLRGQECAIKMLKTSMHDEVDLSNQIKVELAALLKYQHENILTLYGYAVDNQKLCLVYQYLSNGSLEDRLACKDDSMPLSWERRLNIIIGSCKGLNFLHTMGEKPLIHGDIKSANILLDKYYEAKIADLGQAKYATTGSSDSKGFTHITIAESSTKQFSTKAYQAPEVFNGNMITTLSTKSDIFALGVVILEICSALKAHDPNRPYHPFLAELFASYEGDNNRWAFEYRDRSLDCPAASMVQLLDQAKRCLNKTKKSRPDCAKLLDELNKIYFDARRYEYEDYITVSMIPGVSVSSKGPDITRLQQEILEQCQTSSTTSNSFQPYSAYSGTKQKYSEAPWSKEISVPLLLQKGYDSLPEKKNIEDASRALRLSFENDPNRVSFETPQADPVKQAKLDWFDAGNVVENGSEGPFLECDPAKLAYMTSFDYTYSRPRQQPLQIQHPLPQSGKVYSQYMGTYNCSSPEDNKCVNTNSLISELAQQGSSCASRSTSDFRSDVNSTPNSAISQASGPSLGSDVMSKSSKIVDEYFMQIANANLGCEENDEED